MVKDRDGKTLSDVEIRSKEERQNEVREILRQLNHFELKIDSYVTLILYNIHILSLILIQ